MAAYYRYARLVHSVHRRLSQRFREVIEPAVHTAEQSATTLGSFCIGASQISLAQGVREIHDPVVMFEALALIAERGCDPDFRLQGAMGARPGSSHGGRPASPRIESGVSPDSPVRPRWNRSPSDE